VLNKNFNFKQILKKEMNSAARKWRPKIEFYLKKKNEMQALSFFLMLSPVE
jgi:hypothetical protein